MPEVWSALFGRFAIFPQISTERATCQWSVMRGGTVFAAVVVVVDGFAAACWRSWRLNTISPRPIRQTASTIEYQP